MSVFAYQPAAATADQSSGSCVATTVIDSESLSSPPSRRLERELEGLIDQSQDTSATSLGLCYSPTPCNSLLFGETLQFAGTTDRQPDSVSDLLCSPGSPKRSVTMVQNSAAKVRPLFVKRVRVGVRSSPSGGSGEASVGDPKGSSDEIMAQAEEIPAGDDAADDEQLMVDRGQLEALIHSTSERAAESAAKRAAELLSSNFEQLHVQKLVQMDKAWADRLEKLDLGVQEKIGESEKRMGQ